MNNVELAQINQHALDKRAIMHKIKVEDEFLKLSKTHPYYGYVEVSISMVPSFLMFYNNDDVVARKFFWNGSDAYEATSLTLWAALSKNAHIILDIGSYTGIYSFVAAASNPVAKVHAFEGLDRVYNRLLINKLVNKFTNIYTYNYVASNTSGISEFNIYSGESILVSGSTILPKDQLSRPIHETKVVKSIRIDEVFSTDSISLIKIDTEGAEHLVLEGMKNILNTNSPDILIEILSDAQYSIVEKYLPSSKYNYYSINEESRKLTPIKNLKETVELGNLNTLITTKSLDYLSKLL